METNLGNGWQRMIAVLGGIILVIAALYFARVILIPVVMATLLTFILTPLVSSLHRLGLRRIPAVLLVVLLVIGVVVGLAGLLFDQVQSLADDLPQYRQQITQKIHDLRDASKDSWLDRLFGFFAEVGQDMREPAPGKGDPPMPVRVETSNMPLVGTIVGSVLELFVHAGLVLLLLVFMLINREEMRNRLVRLWGRANLTSTTKAFDEAGQRISRFLLMQFVVNASFGLLVGVGLALIGVPYAPVWGLLAGTLRYLPYIGPWLGAFFPTAVSVAVLPGWTPAVLVIGLFLALELIISNVVEPTLYGRSIGVSEVALLIAAAFWTWLWGPWGLVLSTPMTACLAVLGQYVPHLEFLHVLLGDEPILEASETYYQRLLAKDQDEAADVVEKHLANHPVDMVYDELLLPALLLAKRNREEGRLTEQDYAFILEGTRETLFDVVLPRQQEARKEASPDPGEPLPGKRPLVFGFPAENESDELALHFLKQLLDPAKCRFEVISAQTISGEGLALVQEEQPAILCLGSLPVRRLARTRYLCKRFRAQFPELQIVVGCWGVTHDREKLPDMFKDAGADEVALSLKECRDQITSLLPLKPGSAIAKVVANR
jgi:predicted PurR-regulated permease PerM